MGSGGSSKFGDLHKEEKYEKCENIIENVLLENYGDYDYYKKSTILPLVGTDVCVELINPRMVVKDISTGYSIGALPSSEYEYLRNCMLIKKYKYCGKICFSKDISGVVEIRVNLFSNKE